MDKQKLIKDHIGLAIYIAMRSARKCPRLTDLLINEALYGLVYAVEKAETKVKDGNYTPWIGVYVTRFVQHGYLYYKSFNIGKTKVPIYPLEQNNVASYNLNLKRLEVEEIAKQLVKDSIDVEILDLRLQGYKNIEIADLLEMSNVEVSRRRNQMKKRYLEIMK